jgi:phosphate transport system permease protein
MTREGTAVAGRALGVCLYREWEFSVSDHESGVVSAFVQAAPRGTEQSVTARARRRASDRLASPLLATAAIVSGALILLIIAFVFRSGVPLLVKQGWAFVTTGGWDGQLEDAWSNTAAPFGALPLILGTLTTTVGALLVSVAIGLGCAIVIAELAPDAIRRPLETVVQLLAGIPSVVFGLVGLSMVVPFVTRFVPADAVDKVKDVPLDGASILAAVIVLNFMILPFFVSVAVDALRAVPRAYVEGGMALGMRRWRSIIRIQVPAAMPGLLAGAILAAARAVGEAIALSMVAGSIAYIPTLKYGLQYFPFMPVRTMASAIVETGGEAMSVPAIESALFALATLLLLGSLALSLAARWIVAWYSGRTSLRTGREL